MSVEYLTLKQSAPTRTTKELFAWMRATTAAAEKETAAVTEIQRIWRGYNARKYVGLLHFNATEIKRVYRGFKGREKAHWVRREKMTAAEKAYYDSMATQIQKVYRGRLSRVQKQDFYRRKAYVEHVTQATKKLSQQVDSAVDQLNKKLAEDEEVRRDKEFVKITEDLHHLVGTSAQASVFSSPYGEQFSTTAYGLALEDQIRTNASQKIHKSGALKATKPPRRRNKPQQTQALQEGGNGKRISRKKKNSKKKRKERAAKAATAQAQTAQEMEATRLAATKQANRPIQGY